MSAKKRRPSLPLLNIKSADEVSVNHLWGDISLLGSGETTSFCLLDCCISTNHGQCLFYVLDSAPWLGLFLFFVNRDPVNVCTGL